MLKNSHVATTQFLTTSVLLVSQQTKLDVALPILIGTHFGSILPDIDQPNADMSQKFPFVSSLISDNVEHRTATHSLFGLTILFLLLIPLWFLLPYVLNLFSLPDAIAHRFLIGLFIGAIIHLIIDSFSRQGILWLWPFTQYHYSRNNHPYAHRHYSRFFYQVGGSFEKCWLKVTQILVFVEYLLLFKFWLRP